MKRATILAPRHSVPFYVSPIHRPSIYPRFLSLSPEDDFASWLSTEQAAQTAFELDIWYEDIDGIPKWCRSEELSRCVHLDQLRRRGVNHVVSPNTLEFMFAGDPKSVYYLSLEHDEAGVGKSTESDGESSLSHRPRGNRSAMPFRRRGLNVGTLLELINLQSVLVETEREIARVQGAIDSLLRQDIDWRAIVCQLAGLRHIQLITSSVETSNNVKLDAPGSKRPLPTSIRSFAKLKHISPCVTKPMTSVVQNCARPTSRPISFLASARSIAKHWILSNPSA